MAYRWPPITTTYISVDSVLRQVERYNLSQHVNDVINRFIKIAHEDSTQMNAIRESLQSMGQVEELLLTDIPNNNIEIESGDSLMLFVQISKLLSTLPDDEIDISTSTHEHGVSTSTGAGLTFDIS